MSCCAKFFFLEVYFISILQYNLYILVYSFQLYVPQEAAAAKVSSAF